MSNKPENPDDYYDDHRNFLDAEETVDPRFREARQKAEAREAAECGAAGDSKGTHDPYATLIKMDETVSLGKPADIRPGVKWDELNKPPVISDSPFDEPGVGEMPPWIKTLGTLQSVGFWLLTALLAMLGLYVYFQVMSVIQAIATLSSPWWQIATAVLMVLLAFVGWAFLKLSWFYFRRKTNRQVRFSDIERLLTEHQKMQESCGATAKAEKQKQVELLRQYVTDFSRQENWTAEILKEKESDSKDFQKFENVMKVLLCHPGTNGGYRDHDEWLSAYRDHFQKYLDDLAEKQVVYVSQIVAVKTAISPYAIWDMLIVLGWAFHLMKTLCGIYNLRVGTYGTIWLLLQLWGTVFLSGKINQWEEYAQTGFQQITQGFISNSLTQTLLGTAAAKTAAATANYFLMRRLGMAAVAKLKPLVD